MGRIARGTVLQRGDRFFVQLTIAKGRKGRRWFHLSTCSTTEAADERAIIVADFVRRLREAGHDAAVVKIAEKAARATPEVLESLKRIVDGFIRGHEKDEGGTFVPSKKMTFREVGEAWTSGAIHRSFPDHVPIKATASDDGWRLEKHVYPHVEGVPIVTFTLDHAQEVLRNLSAKLAPASRRHVAQLMARILKLAAYPCRIITRSPLPPGFLPRLRGEKALEYLYPDEDAKLLACTEIPLVFRMAYGLLAREGMRTGELVRLTIGDFDLVRGAVKLDENKTDDPRAWALDPGVARALSLYREHFRAGAAEDAPMLEGPIKRPTEGYRYLEADRLAGPLRRHLKQAKIDRPALFERSATRRPIRAHDLRATFVTLSLANGRTEAWIADRTGHKSSVMINRYRRAARKVDELGLGQLKPLDEAVPELAALAPKKSQLESQRVSRRGSGRRGHPRKTSGKVAIRDPRERPVGALGSGGENRESSSLSSCTNALENKSKSRVGEGDHRKGSVALFSDLSCDLNPNSANPRSTLVAELSAHLAALVAAGDLEAARAVSDTIARLLGGTGVPASVVDLAHARKRDKV